MDDIARKLEKIRSLMRSTGIDAWIVNGSDPHASEYVAPRWRTRAWLSGFTGSAGTIVVTSESALLWVDSRYYIQGAQQIEGSPFTLMKLDSPGVPDHVQYLVNTLAPESKVGIDGSCMTVSASRMLESALVPKGIALVDTPDWFDVAWTDRPAVPEGRVTVMDSTVAGEHVQGKLMRIREMLRTVGCTHTIVSSLDDIAWALNLRGNDVAFNPVFLSYLVIGPNQAILFSDSHRFAPEVSNALEGIVTIRPYQEFHVGLLTLFHDDDVLYISPEKTTIRTKASLPASLATVEGRDITTTLKARKSPVEIEGMRRAHLLDGIAMVKLLAHLSRSAENYTELSIAAKLESFRSESREYLGPSFSPIAGFGPHGALAHYSANEDSDVALVGDSLLVLDSGGQYRTGTTDITRTLAFGEPSRQMITDYTLVLKGNLALASQRFPAGTCGYQLDVLARQFLWQSGFNYGHGTGHGIGFCLNVHEGPQNISPKPVVVAIEEGMIISDEPGIYREGSHGVRIENLIVAQHAAKTEFGTFLAFDVLTLCPFERRLIDKTLLTESERQMVDAYHGWVYSELREYLEEEDAAWLRAATLPL